MHPLILFLSTSLPLMIVGCINSKPSEDVENTSTPVEPSTELEEQDCTEMDFIFFEEQAGPLLSTQCFGCHNANSVAANTRHVLLPFDSV